MMQFQATRALLLIGQIQPKVLLALSVGSNLYRTCEKLPAPFSSVVAHWNLSSYRARLLHVSLLSFECLLIVVYHHFVWGSGAGEDGPMRLSRHRAATAPALAAQPATPDQAGMRSLR